jgi:hypothetical protein
MFRIVPLSPRRKTFSAGSRPRIDPFGQLLCQQPEQSGILLAVQPLLGVHGAASRARWNSRYCFAPRLCPPQSRGFRHHLPTQRQAPEKRHFCPQERRGALRREVGTELAILIIVLLVIGSLIPGRIRGLGADSDLNSDRICGTSRSDQSEIANRHIDHHPAGWECAVVENRHRKVPTFLRRCSA